MRKYRFIATLFLVLVLSISCRLFTPSDNSDPAQRTQPPATRTRTARQTVTPAPRSTADRPTASAGEPIRPDEDEPVVITGEIPYTSRFFLSTTAEPYVMLEDQAGFVQRDKEFQFPLTSQVIGPVDFSEEGRLTFTLALPSIPQATFVDVDNDSGRDTGLQVFAVAYWSNTWGDPFLERRDGVGWSSAYASTKTDPLREYEITGGMLVIWSPDDEQGFPTDFGEDEMLFTDDDPTETVPAGYSLVDLDERPFRIYKESETFLTLTEGASEVKDYSSMSYSEAFTTLFDKVSKEYPFTPEKKIDWEALRAKYVPRAEAVNDDEAFYLLMRDFTTEIPDGHVGLSLNQQIFFDTYGGGFGLVVSELSDGTVIVRNVLPGKAAERAGMRQGAVILTWNGKPVGEAIGSVVSGFGPYSSPHAKREGQVIFLTRTAPGARIQVQFQNPGEPAPLQVEMEAETEYDSLFASVPSFNEDPVALPVEARYLPESGLAYLRIASFSDDYNLSARVWERYIQNLIDNEVPGLIIDMRYNGGGSSNLAQDFAGYFFDREIELYQSYYFDEISGEFKKSPQPARIQPAPKLYEGRLAVLVGPNCFSACEGFTYALTQQDRAIVVGHSPTGGGYGEVSRGQYKLPGDLTLQVPTGRSVDLVSGAVIIEGVGVPLDITVPVTVDSALGRVDAVLQAAIAALQNK